MLGYYYSYRFICAMIDHYGERVRDAKTMNERIECRKILEMYRMKYLAFHN